MTLPAGQSRNSPCFRCLLAPSPCVWKKGQKAGGVGISLVAGWLSVGELFYRLGEEWRPL